MRKSAWKIGTIHQKAKISLILRDKLETVGYEIARKLYVMSVLFYKYLNWRTQDCATTSATAELLYKVPVQRSTPRTEKLDHLLFHYMFILIKTNCMKFSIPHMMCCWLWIWNKRSSFTYCWTLLYRYNERTAKYQVDKHKTRFILM